MKSDIQPSNYKILVVEDEEMMREILADELTRHGFKVLQAEDGKKAIQLWEKEKPNLVLLDLMLPEMSGSEILQKMRSSPNKTSAEVPVIVITNVWSKEEKEKILQYNIDNFLVKAYVTTEEIIDRVKEALEKKATTMSI